MHPILAKFFEIRHEGFYTHDRDVHELLLEQWSILVRKRDERCRHCGSRLNLHAHHVQPKFFYPNLSLDLDNGICLCKTCHENVHKLEKPDSGRFVEIRFNWICQPMTDHRRLCEAIAHLAKLSQKSK